MTARRENIHFRTYFNGHFLSVNDVEPIPELWLLPSTISSTTAFICSAPHGVIKYMYAPYKCVILLHLMNFISRNTNLVITPLKGNAEDQQVALATHYVFILKFELP